MKKNELLFILGVIIISLNCCKSNSSTNTKDIKIEYQTEIQEVEITELRYEDFPIELISNGKLKAMHHSDLAFETNGTISSLNVSNGDFVKAGYTIAELSRPDLDLSLQAAKNSLQQCELELYDILAGQGYQAKDTTDIPKNILTMAKIRSGYIVAKNNFERATIELRGTTLKSPYSGRIANLKFNKFDNYIATDSFCTIIDDSSFLIEFPIMESEYTFLNKDVKVRIIPYSLNTKEIIGKLEWINPSIDKNGQITVCASVKNDGSLIDGMNVKVIVYHNIPKQLVVPRSAVLMRDNQDILFTYTEDSVARWTYIKIIESNGDSHAVVADSEKGSILNEGDMIITSGNLNLADGNPVKLKK